MPSVKYPQLNDPEWVLEQKRIHGGWIQAARANEIPRSNWRLFDPDSRKSSLDSSRKNYQKHREERLLKHAAYRQNHRKEKRANNVCRIWAGASYLGTVDTPQLAAGINSRIAERLSNFRNGQQSERDNFNREAA